MPEKLLNGLIHLFALLACTRGHEGVETTLPLLAHYLKHNLGLRNLEDYTGLFEAMADMYLSGPAPTPETVEEKITELTQLLSPHLPVQEQYAFLIYFLEIQNTFPAFESPFDDLVLRISRGFNIPEQTLSAFRILNSRDVDTARVSSEAGVYIFPPQRENGESAALFGSSLICFFPRDMDGAFIAPLSQAPLFLDGNPVDNKMIKLLSQGSLLSDRFGQSLYFSELKNYFIDKAYAPILFTGEHVDFRFPGSNNGLHDFSFRLQGGDFVGVMGASGAGKSTLLNILNGSMAPDSGVVSVNGVDLYKNADTLEGIMGIIPQDDLLFEDLTVYENLDFAARFCLSHLSSAERNQRVVSTLTQLKQLEIAGLKVGSPTEKTISGGQRKRLNIALELIRKPRILFVDEPTSGLSSGDSENVMGLLKAQAALGSIVIVVIHQPSSNLFRMFDRLWILDTGGYPIFDGRPIESVRTFREESQIAGSDQCICRECGNVTPEQLFNIIEACRPDAKGAFTRERQVAPEEWHRLYRKRMAEQVSAPEIPDAVPESLPGASDCLKRPGKIKQVLIFTCRNFKNRLSNRQYVWVNLLVPLLLGCLSAALCLGGQDRGYVFRENANIPTFFFVAVIFALFAGLNISGEEILKDARTLLREKFLNLSWGGYVVSKFLFLGTLIGTQMGLFLIPSYLILELPTDIPLAWGILFSLAMVSCAVGLNISASFKNVSAIYILIPLILIPQILLCGAIIPFEELTTKKADHRNVPLVADLMPSRWGYEAVLMAQFVKNAYRSPFLEEEMKVRQAEYLLNGVLPELNSMAEAPFIIDMETGKPRKNPAEFQLFRNELLKLKPYEKGPMPVDIASLTVQDYTQAHKKKIKQYLKEVRKSVWQYRKQVAQKKKEIQDTRLEKLGFDRLAMIEKKHANRRLEELMFSSLRPRLLLRGKERFIQIVSPVSLLPDSALGRAHFLARYKRLGSVRIPTQLFNLGVLWAIFALAGICLKFRLLGRGMSLFGKLQKSTGS